MKAARLEVVGRAEPVFPEQPARADHRPREEPHGRIERDGLRAGDLEIELEVILEVLADTRPVGDDLDALLVKLRRGPDAGELQELRRVDRPRAHDDFAPRMHRVQRLAKPVLDTDGASPVEKDACDEGSRLHGKVRPAHGGPQVGVGCTAATTVRADGHVEATEAFLLVAVDVVGRGVARLPAGREPGGVKRIRERAVARLERALVAAVIVAARRAFLGTAKVRQDRRVVPARRTLGFPALEILRVAAYVYEAVDRRGPA
jgi:hypothetical protein